MRLLGGLPLFGGVTDRLQLEAMGIEPVRRVAMFPVLRELAWFIQDDSLACTRPLVRFPDDRSARDQEGEMMEAGLVP
jgi:hypothetical protein